MEKVLAGKAAHCPLSVAEWTLILLLICSARVIGRSIGYTALQRLL